MNSFAKTAGQSSGEMLSVSLNPDWLDIGKPFRHSWSSIGNIDQFRWLSRADVQRHLAMARDELGLKHVRAVAMYSPELRVWENDIADWRKPAIENTKRANWQLVDISIESLIEIGLKPIYTTCFTPADFTDDPTVCWPDRNHTGMPRDLNQWGEFVSSGIRHHLARYGKAELRSWYFECWNEPNLKGCFFGGTKEEFFQMWSATWRAVKSVDPELRFGGPSTARGEWIPDFLDFTAKDGTSPDYLISHVYNNDSESSPLSPFDGPASYKVKDSPHFASGVIRGMRSELNRRGWTGEIHWNEWGRSWFIQDDLRETALEAAFIAKTMCEVSQEADVFSYWCLSDVYDQMGFQSSEFQGHYGMLSLHGLRKPSWQTHVLLDRLGQSSVPVTGGNELVNAVATRSVDGAQILIYAHPPTLGETVKTHRVQVSLPRNAKTPRLFRIGAKDNNILANWRALGAPPYPTASQIAQLRAENSLRESADNCLVENNKATFELECPGVALIEC